MGWSHFEQEYYGCVDMLSDRWGTHAPCPSSIVKAAGVWWQRQRARRVPVVVGGWVKECFVFI